MFCPQGTASSIVKRVRPGREIPLAFLAFWFLSSCAAFDVFEPAGPRNLVISYTGPAELQVGDRAAVTVEVLLDGVALPAPRLRISISNLTVIELSSTADSMVALKPGNTDLTIRLEHSIFAGERPDTTIQLRVRQTGGPP